MFIVINKGFILGSRTSSLGRGGNCHDELMHMTRHCLSYATATPRLRHGYATAMASVAMTSPKYL